MKEEWLNTMHFPYQSAENTQAVKSDVFDTRRDPNFDAPGGPCRRNQGR